MADTLVFEDDEKRVYATQGGTPGEPGHYTGTRVEWKPGTAEVNETTIGDRLDQALTALRAHVDRAKPSTAAAQASAAYDATVLLCRVAIGVIRVMRRRLDATD